MHLRGHDSNHAGSLQAALEAFPDGLPKVELGRTEPGSARTGRLGNREIQRAVARALSAAGRPLRLAEILDAVESDLGSGVSRDSVKCCLTAGIRGATPLFERVERGSYVVSRSG
jgi:hypothetical protein